MSTNNTNAKCAICGTPYKVCRTCVEQKTFKPWRTVTDTIEHYKIYMAIHGYTVSSDKERAKHELEKCNLSGLDSFNPEIKSVISEIMEEPKKQDETKRQENASKTKKNKAKKPEDEMPDDIGAVNE